MSAFMFTPTKDAEPAQFIVENLKDFAVNVGSIIPAGFEAYARVLHPAHQISQEQRLPLRWAEVARRCNRIVHNHMWWENIYNPEIFKGSGSELELPEEGVLPVDIAGSIREMLARHTVYASQCYFAIWEGFGCLSEAVRQAASFEIPERKFHLFSGDISLIEQTFCSRVSKEDIGIFSQKPLSQAERKKALEEIDLSNFPILHQSANLWWPKDRAWCVATEIDFKFSFVAGSRRGIDEILASRDLEVYEVKVTDTLYDLMNASL